MQDSQGKETDTQIRSGLSAHSPDASECTVGRTARTPRFAPADQPGMTVLILPLPICLPFCLVGSLFCTRLCARLSRAVNTKTNAAQGYQAIQTWEWVCP
jgi:hypothetical protein